MGGFLFFTDPEAALYLPKKVVSRLAAMLGGGGYTKPYDDRLRRAINLSSGEQAFIRHFQARYQGVPHARTYVFKKPNIG